MRKLFIFIAIIIALPLSSARLLIFMDTMQSDHLRAYGIAYHALLLEKRVEWLLNYRSGSFLIDYDRQLENLCTQKQVSYSIVSEAEVKQIYDLIESNNMEKIILEEAAKVAVYVPPHSSPWDDAVRLALEYADIPYDNLWDEEVLSGALSSYDWVHLHHEDFTGQYGKFYRSYHNADWYKKEVAINENMAKRLGFSSVWRLKHAVALNIREYVEDGGFLFAMCSATETIDIALAALEVDIVGQPFDGTPEESNFMNKLDYNSTFAFTDFTPDVNPLIYNHSDIDVTREAHRRGENVYFTLKNFDAKYDPISSMLTQDHTKHIREYLGQNTGFKRNLIKDDVVVLADVKDTEEVKYIYGDRGKGFFTFLGGHDPEDFAHLVGDPPTALENFPNSPGYRLILNNILFPAAKTKRLKT
ncbi:asparagine synthetase B [candidate division WOR-3 bacterium]|nr:asparagine synthetase B [candidate division WOR-3 bacterium]